MPNILLALDCSPHSRRAAEYVAQLAPHLPDCRLSLLVVCTGIPYSAQAAAEETAPEVHGDEDHQQERQEIDAFLGEIEDLLIRAGFPAARLERRVKPLGRGVVQDILDEAAAAQCDTLVVGRRGVSKMRALLLGSVSAELVRQAGGRTVWVVE
ncbi:universal stress protein [Geoalkalibacter sp.]|uniref:universal stress protein n=1 Tax=Geoalkalibacter sp. TaxID=3041440 RepID=UPI00272EB6F6|nr:universal stress protein [Geoalkalibacter sp.]